MSAPEAGSSWSYRKQHLSDSLKPDRMSGGRYGPALCHSTGNPAYVYDQAAHDVLSYRLWDKPRAKRITDLPPCKKCAKATARAES